MDNGSNWQILYWNDSANVSQVEKWLDKLSNEQLKSIAKEMYLLSECGNSLKLPHSKSMGKGLFELRDRTYGFRIYYAFLGNRKIVMLQAGNKVSQVKDVKIAR